jgi:hypothetical protein
MPETPSGELLNLTPHTIRVHTGEDSVVVYPVSGVVARLRSRGQKSLGFLTDGVPVVEPQVFVGITPPSPPAKLKTEETRGVIVSMVVAEWLCSRGRAADLYERWGEIYVPDTGTGAVRDPRGVIVGTRRLCRYLSRD